MPYDSLIAGYLAHADAVAHDHEDEHFWAYEGLHGLVEKKPDIAWPVVIEVISRVTDDDTLDYVAADILEDLICANPSGLIERIEELARADGQFRSALKGVSGWTRMPRDVRDRLDAIVGRRPSHEMGDAG